MRKTRSTGNIKPKTVDNKAVPEQEVRYEFINKTYSRYLNCPICKTLMKNPTRLHPCGHTFCNTCTPSKGKCPTCSAKIVEAQKDLVGEGLINQMTVRCLNDGCPYKGTYDQYKKFHQAKCALGNGLDEWLKSMNATLQRHNQDKRFNYQDDNSGQKESQQKQKSVNKLGLDLKRPKSPQKRYDFEQELLKKQRKSQL